MEEKITDDSILREDIRSEEVVVVVFWVFAHQTRENDFASTSTSAPPTNFGFGMR